jgi:SAM-dependent methyltransferase
MNNIDLGTFKRFAERYVPFEWEIDRDTHQEDFRGKHSVLINLIRYWYAIQYIQTGFQNERIRSVVDVGSYPGCFVKILRELIDGEIEYTGIGLGFSEEYSSTMKALGVQLFATELDPEFIKPEIVREWPVSNIDCCLLLDVIEHLVNPIHCLDKINSSLRMGGKLVITTDNIASFGYIHHMLKRGGSPNTPPVKSQLFYRGDWRPHFKEYSRDELAFFVEYCGFKLVKHEYFERKQGQYYLDHKGICRNKYAYQFRGIKSLALKLLLRYLPHVRNHQVLIAEKIVEFRDIVGTRPSPTRDMKEWLKIRQSLGC